MDLLQSNGWEQFQRALGRTTHRVDGVLAIEMPLPFGGVYLYSPRGSLPFRHCEEPEERRGNLTPSVQHLAEETDAILWRMEVGSEFRNFKFQISNPRVLKHALEPEWTWRVDLTPSEEQLLAGMHPKHRYNIRIAERHGVTMRVMPPPRAPPPGEGVRGGDDFYTFWALLQETAKRQRIQTHPRAYYESMLRMLSRQSQADSRKPDTDCFLCLVEHNGTPVAAAIVAYHGDTITYLHGGSSCAHRSLMAPHLLHWQAMREAKAAGLKWYDFGGISPPRAGISKVKGQRSNSDWAGMTRFKMGFDGETVHHPPTRDLVFRPGWYRLLSWMAMMRP